MIYVNWLGVILASISSFVLAYFWYNQKFFGRTWQRENNLSDEQLRSGNKTKIYGISFLMIFVYAYMLAKTIIRTDFSGMADGLKFGFMVGTCFAAMSLGINYQFARKSNSLFLIDAAYIVVSSTIMGAIIGWMA
ncbi:MAG: DUF1761 domain-containing protein [Saprospiraceae bacterium]|nr:DUF1761 domain-containing protein [Saprospiraceae bacterium]MBK8483724.1 DUF1761 domain-containing protein [Saprospiraceae bacterium]MBK9721888.1 DUF1761 domain-containing protein [Saprospiraceae bacterium]